MRQTQIFSGSSHPALVEAICDRLGQRAAKAELGKFSNGETKIHIQTSIRDQDVFIVQSGSSKINDAVMELLIMVSACKGGSARSITAVMPYFPYSRQSKKKSHRGSITARMLANLLDVAGVNHVITIDLHASQMQGFFHSPVDNLVAEPLIAHWIKMNIAEWKQAAVVSKNPGGTKRVTSLADALKLSFGIVMTDTRRSGSGRNSINASAIFDTAANQNHLASSGDEGSSHANGINGQSTNAPSALRNVVSADGSDETLNHEILLTGDRPDVSRVRSAPVSLLHTFDDSEDEGLSTGPSEVVTGRLVHGHIVDDDDDDPLTQSTYSQRTLNGQRQHSDDELPDLMTSSILSTASSIKGLTENGLGGSGDAADSEDDEEENLKNPDFESTVTLVGKVKDRTVLIVDDMIDKSASWIAAAETVVKRGGATKVYCMATHGLFGGDCLREMEDCECIHSIIVTNAFPIPALKARDSAKLVTLDVSGLLSEAIRRNHHGESISQLYMHYD